MEKRFRLEENGIEVILGKFAEQADGAAWVQQGGTIVLSTVCSAQTQEFPGFLPLTVDYREIFAAAGKIPGGYFKREGKFTDKEVLTGRLIDRSIRPLFPENFFNQVQVLSTVYSVDKEHIPNSLALLATSIALTTSKIPFMGPVGVAEVARVEGKWVVNPLHSQTLQSDVKIIVAGTEEGICMVEGSCKEISESEFVDVLFMAYDELKKQVLWQKKMAQEINVEKEPVVDKFDWQFWKQKANTFLTKEVVEPYFNADKLVRGKVLSDLKDAFLKVNAEDVEKKWGF